MQWWVGGWVGGQRMCCALSPEYSVHTCMHLTGWNQTGMVPLTVEDAPLRLVLVAMFAGAIRQTWLYIQPDS